MHVKQEDIYDAFLELDKRLSHEEMKPGDITAKMLSERYGISENAAREKMRRLSKEPCWDIVVVWKTDISRAVKVLRKVE